MPLYLIPPTPPPSDDSKERSAMLQRCLNAMELRSLPDLMQELIDLNPQAARAITFAVALAVEQAKSS